MWWGKENRCESEVIVENFAHGKWKQKVRVCCERHMEDLNTESLAKKVKEGIEELGLAYTGKAKKIYKQDM
jgi:hypothetical protein